MLPGCSFTLKQINDFLNDSDDSDTANLINMNPHKIQKLILKQNFLEKNNFFDPKLYFGGLEINDLSDPPDDDRFEGKVLIFLFLIFKIIEMFRDLDETETEIKLPISNEKQPNVERSKFKKHIEIKSENDYFVSSPKQIKSEQKTTKPKNPYNIYFNLSSLSKTPNQTNKLEKPALKLISTNTPNSTKNVENKILQNITNSSNLSTKNSHKKSHSYFNLNSKNHFATIISPKKNLESFNFKTSFNLKTVSSPKKEIGKNLRKKAISIFDGKSLMMKKYDFSNLHLKYKEVLAEFHKNEKK